MLQVHVHVHIHVHMLMNSPPGHTHLPFTDLSDKVWNREIPMLIHFSNVAHLVDQSTTSFGTDNTKVLEECYLSFAGLWELRRKWRESEREGRKGIGEGEGG